MNTKIEIYSTPWCSYCNMAKEYFKKNNFEYTEYDVSTDKVKQQEMLNKTHQMGVPVIVINDKVVVGFDRGKIRELLGIN
ncbi:MAG TPA: Uxx-star family glutaredoxin-like (seleno)protein [Candidatus Paceibacterota bacterium]